MAAKDMEERRDRLQVTMLIGATVGTSGFALQELCEMLGVGGGAFFALALLTLAGWVLFAGATFRASRMAKADGGSLVLEDERRDQLRAESFKFGFIAVMAVQVLGLLGGSVLAGLTDDVRLSLSFVAALTIAVGVVASMGRFVYLNR